jgi:integrase
MWVESESGIKDSTRMLYRRNISNHIIPLLGDVQLKRLTSDMIQEFVNELKLAPSTVKLIFNILESSLKTAQSKGLISNVWSNIKLPKRSKDEVTILTPVQQHKLENVLTDKNDIGILICLYTGLRIGELCALRWKDIDFDNALIHISGTQSRINGKLKITPPKSKTSKRTIPIPDCLMKRLLTHKNNSEFVISNNSKPIDLRVYRRRFKMLLKKAGLPDIKFHALRHTFSSRALEVGMDYKTLSEILGHASVGITMDLYVHALDEHKKKQMNKLNEIYNLPSK